MNTWIVVLIVILGIYAAGFFGMLLYVSKAENAAVLAALWPLTLLWMLIGNIQ